MRRAPKPGTEESTCPSVSDITASSWPAALRSAGRPPPARTLHTRKQGGAPPAHPHGAAAGTYDLAFAGVFPYAALAPALLLSCIHFTEPMTESARISGIAKQEADHDPEPALKMADALQNKNQTDPKIQVTIFAHPLFLKSESMPRFARMLRDGLAEAGHSATIVRPTAYFSYLFENTRLAKWAGYLDQYIIFPFRVITVDLTEPKTTLFVFADQALGPWIPFVRRHKTVVHCLDLLALKSALGLVPENLTSPTGRIYQKYIRWGFRHCRNFISISARTASDLIRYGEVSAEISEVVHLSLNYNYRPVDVKTIEERLRGASIKVTPENYLLYVGGGQWYKNRKGLIRIYKEYATGASMPLPLVCVSPAPELELLRQLDDLPNQAKVIFIQGISNQVLEALYSGARAMLFPSLAEGFGWPIVEAQACGCPVITTDDSPMNEIAGPVARLLPLLDATSLQSWEKQGALVLNEILSADGDKRKEEKNSAITWTAKFHPGADIPEYIEIYKNVLNPIQLNPK